MTWRSIGIAIIGFFLALALGAAAEYWFASTPAGQALLRDFLVSQTQKQANADIADIASSTLVYKTGTLPIPESYATTEYFLAINNVIADIALINNASIELAPVLERLNLQTLSCSFNGFYDLMGQARAVANRNQALASQFLMHISSLSSANVKTMDAITKSQTQALVTAGQTLGAALQTYVTNIQTLLYGDTPTSAELAEFEAKMTSVVEASQVFADALTPLLQHIGTEVQRLSDSTTPTN